MTGCHERRKPCSTFPVVTYCQLHIPSFHSATAAGWLVEALISDGRLVPTEEGTGRRRWKKMCPCCDVFVLFSWIPSRTCEGKVLGRLVLRLLLRLLAFKVSSLFLYFR